MKKVVLAGFPYVSNLGDPVLFESTEYLIKKILNDDSVIIERLDLFGENEVSNIKKLIVKLLSRVSKMFYKNRNINTKFHYRIEKHLIKTAVHRYYKKKLVGANCLIFAGGGLLKYKYETCDYRLSILTEIANEKNIPVAFNAVGVEGYLEANVRCQEMKKVLNSNVVKMITTRDDIELLDRHYVTNPNIITHKVADSAFWSDFVYNQSKNVNSDIIGLGVVRSGIFTDNGNNLSEESLVELWIDIIKEIEEKGLKWKLYTNGLDEDNKFIDLLLDKINRSTEKEQLTCIPDTSYELVEITSRFNKIIACRMHASIIAYSLDIPSIGLIWNDKIRMFGDTIRHSERFFEPKDFNAKHIVDELMHTSIEEADIRFKKNLRKITYDYLKIFLDSINA